MDTRTAAQRISDARTWLTEVAPFFGSQALNLAPVEAPWHGSGGTDGTRLYYNPKWAATLDDVELGTFLAHEVGHCDLGHLWRRDGRPALEWNEACDYAVNQLLVDSQDGRVFRLGKDWLIDPRFKGMDAEAIFALRRKEREEQEKKEEEKQRQQQEEQQDEPEGGEDDEQAADEPEGGEDQEDGGEDGQEADPAGEPDDGGAGAESDEQADDPDLDQADGPGGDGEGEEDDQDVDEQEQPGANGRPQFLDPQDEAQDGQGAGAGEPGEDGEEGGDEPEELTELDWQIIAEQATAVASKNGHVTGETAGQVRAAREQDTSCWEVLRRFLEQQVPQDTSLSTPNRRFIWQDAYLPGPLRENLPGVRLIVDTSGSVTRRMRELFRDHIQLLVREFRPAYVEVVYCDTAVQRVQVFSPEDELDLLDIPGGGTYFQPALDWEAGGEDDPAAGDFRAPPCCAIYLTDTYGGVEREPEYPVLWAYPEHIYSPSPLPFGEFVKLSEWGA